MGFRTWSTCLMVLGTVLLGSVLPTAKAFADDDGNDGHVAAPHDSWDRLLGVEVNAGIETPYGIGGAAVLLSPFRYLTLDLGGGVSRDGGRFAFGARLMFPQGNGAFGIRAGIGGGPLTWNSGAFRQTWDMQWYFSTEVSAEIRTREGWFGRLSFGVEQSLDGSSDTCTGPMGNCGSGTNNLPARPYAGIAIGYMFDIENAVL